MEPSKYYDYDSGKDGAYNVHFPNKPGYSNEEIIEIFSEFGNVVGVTKAGDEHGFRFVRFRTEEEILRCVEGLKNHPTVRLLPKKPRFGKDQNNGQRRNATNRHESREPKSTWAAWDQQKSGDGNSYRNNPQRNNQPDFSRHTNEPLLPDKNADNLNVNHISRINNNAGDKHKEDPGNLQEMRQGGSDETVRSATSFIHQEIQVGAETASVTSSLKNVTLQNVPEAAERQREAIPQAKLLPLPKVIDDLPRLVEKRRKLENITEATKSQPVVTAKIVEARAVIVGNVHIDYGIHYILHLFQKHDPISVTPMKIIPKYGLRYCIVYLQSPQQALDIEIEFDNYLLNGKELIVLREQRLLELGCVV